MGVKITSLYAYTKREQQKKKKERKKEKKSPTGVVFCLRIDLIVQKPIGVKENKVIVKCVKINVNFDQTVVILER